MGVQTSIFKLVLLPFFLVEVGALAIHCSSIWSY